jgi:CsoR family transcriptional regulator, copper-sensing transcriptional repressor
MTGPTGDPAPLTVSEAERRSIQNRLKRLEGQIRGLQAMVDADKDCQEVLTQVMAAKSALNRVGLLIIGHSMKSCLAQSDAVDRDEIIDEALVMLMRYVNLPETWSGPDVE